MSIHDCKSFRTVIASSLLSLIAWGSAMYPAQVQPSIKNSNLYIENPRPLNEALTSIERDLGIPISLEEAIPDRELLVGGAVLGLSPTKRYLKSNHMSVQFVEGETNPLSAVQTALNAYSKTDHAATYVATQDSTGILVTPINAKNAPISATLIDLPISERTVADLVNLVAVSLSQKSGIPVIVLNQPYLNGEKITCGAEREPAIGVLEKISEKVAPTSFRFIYDSSEGAYYLNLAAIGLAPRTGDVVRPAIPKDSMSNSPFFVKDK